MSIYGDYGLPIEQPLFAILIDDSEFSICFACRLWSIVCCRLNQVKFNIYFCLLSIFCVHAWLQQFDRLKLEVTMQHEETMDAKYFMCLSCPHKDRKNMILAHVVASQIQQGGWAPCCDSVIVALFATLGSLKLRGTK